MVNLRKPTCIVCRLPTGKLFLKKRGGKYYRCGQCQGIFVSPVREQTYYLDSDTYLKDMDLYTGRIDPHGQRWMIEQFERLYQDVMEREGRGSYFEIGAGIGYLTLFALSRGWDASGIETSKMAVEHGKKNLKVDLKHSTIEDFKTDKAFDAVVMVEVLEHFLDPAAALEAIRNISKRWTFIFGTTPNTDSDHWKGSEQDIYQPEDHIFLFNKPSLTNLADKLGIQKLTIEYFGGGKNHDSNLMYAGILENKNATS